MSFVYAAYLVVLGGIGLYAWSLHSRFSELRKEVPPGEDPSGGEGKNRHD